MQDLDDLEPPILAYPVFYQFEKVNIDNACPGPWVLSSKPCASVGLSSAQAKLYLSQIAPVTLK
jgi:hypothetical protein